jgi:hypothetical protein
MPRPLTATLLRRPARRHPFDASVVDGDRAERSRGELVSGNYFDVLGVTPLLGRTIVPSDDTAPEAHPVAVLSFNYFRRRFGGNPAVLNRTIVVNGRALTVVGVARPGFDGVQRGRPADLFVPMTMKASMTPSWNGLDNPKDYWLQMIGRLRPNESRRRSRRCSREPTVPCSRRSSRRSRAGAPTRADASSTDGSSSRPAAAAGRSCRASSPGRFSR